MIAKPSDPDDGRYWPQCGGVAFRPGQCPRSRDVRPLPPNERRRRARLAAQTRALLDAMEKVQGKRRGCPKGYKRGRS